MEQKARLQTAVGLIDNILINPDIDINYFIPGVLVTENFTNETENGGPFIQFTYRVSDADSHIQHVPLKHGYMDKSPEDLANLVTFSLERFMEEIDSRQYSAQ